jgi:hypothetical protein
VVAIGGATHSKRWLIGSAVVLVVGTLVRLILAGAGLPSLSGTILAVLLWLGVWAATLLLAPARAAFFVGIAAMAILDLAALQPRTPVAYDDREVLYRTDQVLARQVTASAGHTLLLILAEPVFEGVQARFGLAGLIGASSVEWSCPFRHGIQRLALPLPAPVSGPLDVQLRLTGAPSRETDYLMIFASSAERGPLISVAESGGDATLCVSLAARQ